MALYELSIGPCASAVNAQAATIIGPSSDAVRLMEAEIQIVANLSNSPVYGLGRPGAVGTDPTSPQTVLPLNPSDPTGKTTMCTAWTTTAPTVPSAYFRLWDTGSNYTPAINWLFFPMGIVIPASGNLVFWIFNQASVDSYIRIVVDE